MQNSHIVQALKSLAAWEFRGFREWVQSPFFNKNQHVVSLMDFLAEHYPDFDHPQLERSQAFHLLFPNQPFSAQKLYDHLSYLYQLFEDFLAWKALEKRPHERELLQLSELNDRGLQRAFRKKEKRLDRKLTDITTRDGDWQLHRVRFFTESDLFFARHEIQSKRRKDPSLQRKGEHLDRYYLATKFRDYCEMLNRQNVLSEQYDLSGLDATIALYTSRQAEFETEPAIAIYYTILQTLLDSETEHWYEELISLLRAEAHRFSRAEARAMYDFGQNYCIKKINSGRSDYLLRFFELFQELIATNLIMEDNRLSQWDYKNIVSVAIRLEKFDWVEQFITDFHDHLDPTIRENAFAYNLATIHYARGNYGQALRQLQQVEFTDVFYHLGTKSTILKIYYETDEIETLLSHIAAFKTYLDRNKVISRYQYKVHNNLLRFTKKLVRNRLKGTMSSTKAKELDAAIRQAEEVANKDWLLRKVAELPT